MSPRIKHIAVNARAPSPTREQLAVLGAIAKQPKGTRVTVTLIAVELGISDDAAHARLSRMAKAGLVRRTGWEVAQ